MNLANKELQIASLEADKEELEQKVKQLEEEQQKLQTVEADKE